jgi:hypothetical protein
MARIEDFASFKSELLGTLGGHRPHCLNIFTWLKFFWSTFYDLIFVFSTLPGKKEYFEIHVHKKCTKLTPEELKAIALMYLVTLMKNVILSWAQLYCWVKTTIKNSAIFYSLSALFGLMTLFGGAIRGSVSLRLWMAEKCSWTTASILWRDYDFRFSARSYMLLQRKRDVW